MGHWNGDRDCEPAQLTGCLLGVEGFLLAAYRAGFRVERPVVGLNPGVPTLSINMDEAHRRAEALFKKEKQSREGQQAMAGWTRLLQRCKSDGFRAAAARSGESSVAMASRSKKACGRPSSTERTWRERGAAGFGSRAFLIRREWCLSMRLRRTTKFR
jgi:hypothetical protein